MTDTETGGKLVIPGRLTRFDGTLHGQAVTPAEGLKDVPDEAGRGLLLCVHGGNPSFFIVSAASGSFMLSPSAVDRQPG